MEHFVTCLRPLHGQPTRSKGPQLGLFVLETPFSTLPPPLLGGWTCRPQRGHMVLCTNPGVELYSLATASRLFSWDSGLETPPLPNPPISGGNKRRVGPPQSKGGVAW